VKLDTVWGSSTLKVIVEACRILLERNNEDPKLALDPFAVKYCMCYMIYTSFDGISLSLTLPMQGDAFPIKVPASNIIVRSGQSIMQCCQSNPQKNKKESPSFKINYPYSGYV
jgi:hypothetical protein